jgi:hypothetical protein
MVSSWFQQADFRSLSTSSYFPRALAPVSIVESANLEPKASINPNLADSFQDLDARYHDLWQAIENEKGTSPSLERKKELAAELARFQLLKQKVSFLIQSMQKSKESIASNFR